MQWVNIGSSNIFVLYDKLITISLLTTSNVSWRQITGAIKGQGEWK